MRQTSAKYANAKRKSPPYPSTQCRVGVTARGNDGGMWAVVASRSGKRRWHKLTDTTAIRLSQRKLSKKAKTRRSAWDSLYSEARDKKDSLTGRYVRAHEEFGAELRAWDPAEDKDGSKHLLQNIRGEDGRLKFDVDKNATDQPFEIGLDARFYDGHKDGDVAVYDEKQPSSMFEYEPDKNKRRTFPARGSRI